MDICQENACVFFRRLTLRVTWFLHFITLLLLRKERNISAKVSHSPHVTFSVDP